MLQTRSFQQRILAAAAATGYHGLHWYIEAKVSHSLIVAVCWPPDWVPLISVGPDPVVSRHYADILRELVASNSERDGTEFAVALTHDEALGQLGTQHYTFGEQDHVCPWCAVVGWGQCDCPSTPPPDGL